MNQITFRLKLNYCYIGPREAAGIVNWLKKKTGPAAQSLNSVDEAKTFVGKDDVVVVGFFKDAESDAAKAFTAAALATDDVPFGVTSNSEVFAEYKISGDAVVLFKKVGSRCYSN